MEWEKMNIEAIISGKNPDGSPLLKSFLIDYGKAFNTNALNASCKSCIDNYHKKYIKAMSDTSNKSKYRLHPKYEGIPLTFGSPVMVTNQNITDTRAKEIIKRYKKAYESNGQEFDISSMFSKYPTPKKKSQSIEEEE